MSTLHVAPLPSVHRQSVLCIWFNRNWNVVQTSHDQWLGTKSQVKRSRVTVTENNSDSEGRQN